MTEHADVDYIFDIPLELAEHLVGFKHDKVCKHLANGTFIVATDTTPKQSF